MLLVIDMSHWQNDPDPAALKAAGVVGIIHKLYEYAADPPMDEKYARRKKLYTDAGFLWAGYCYEDGYDGVMQADKFIDAAQPDGSTGLVLDLEKYANFQQAQEFIVRVYNRTGVYPILYSRYEYIVSQLLATKSHIFANCLLWLADPNVTSNPRVPLPWTTWFLWQQGTIIINSVAVDRNWFNGTLDELKIRWQSASGVLRPLPDLPEPVYQGFDWPVGDENERATATNGLPAGWEDDNPIGNYYEISPGKWNYHDGSDLNKNVPVWNDDYLQDVYAIGEGRVTFMGSGGGSWGHIIDIKHPTSDGSYVVSRFGHIANPLVNTGDVVKKGQIVAQVGNADGYYAVGRAHLHWNISRPGDPIMIDTPNQWCGTNASCVDQHYIDPKQFVISHKQGDSTVPNVVPVQWLAPQNRVDVYEQPSILSRVVNTLLPGGSSQVDKDAFVAVSGQPGFYPVSSGFVAADCIKFVDVPAAIRYVNTPGSNLLVRSTGEKKADNSNLVKLSNGNYMVLQHGTQVTVILPANVNGYVQLVTIAGAKVTGSLWVAAFNNLLVETPPK